GTTLRENSAIAGKARGQFLNYPGRHRMMIATGQERGARGRAQSRRVELAVRQAMARQPLGSRHPHEPAAYAGPAVANVIEQNDDDIGRPWRCLLQRREVSPGIAVRHPDLCIRKPMLRLRVHRASYM